MAHTLVDRPRSARSTNSTNLSTNSTAEDRSVDNLTNSRSMSNRIRSISTDSSTGIDSKAGQVRLTSPPDNTPVIVNGRKVDRRNHTLSTIRRRPMSSRIIGSEINDKRVVSIDPSEIELNKARSNVRRPGSEPTIKQSSIGSPSSTLARSQTKDRKRELNNIRTRSINVNSPISIVKTDSSISNESSSFDPSTDNKTISRSKDSQVEKSESPQNSNRPTRSSSSHNRNERQKITSGTSKQNSAHNILNLHSPRPTSNIETKSSPLTKFNRDNRSRSNNENRHDQPVVVSPTRYVSAPGFLNTPPHNEGTLSQKEGSGVIIQSPEKPKLAMTQSVSIPDRDDRRSYGMFQKSKPRYRSNSYYDSRNQSNINLPIRSYHKSDQATIRNNRMHSRDYDPTNRDYSKRSSRDYNNQLSRDYNNQLSSRSHDNQLSSRGYRIDSRGYDDRPSSKGYRINSKSHDNQLSSRGYRINSKGYLINSRGYRINSKGYQLNSRGYDDQLNSKGYQLNSRGYDDQLNSRGYRINIRGHDDQLDSRGYRINIRGHDNQLSSRGYQLDSRGYQLDSRGHDNQLNSRGYRMDSRGYRINSRGYNDRIDSRGSRYINESNNKSFNEPSRSYFETKGSHNVIPSSVSRNHQDNSSPGNGRIFIPLSAAAANTLPVSRSSNNSNRLTSSREPQYELSHRGSIVNNRQMENRSDYFLSPSRNQYSPSRNREESLVRNGPIFIPLNGHAEFPCEVGHGPTSINNEGTPINPSYESNSNQMLTPSPRISIRPNQNINRYGLERSVRNKRDLMSYEEEIRRLYDSGQLRFDPYHKSYHKSNYPMMSIPGPMNHGNIVVTKKRPKKLDEESASDISDKDKSDESEEKSSDKVGNGKISGSNIKPINSENMPDYDNMSGVDQARYRAHFEVMFGDMRTLHPQYNIPDMRNKPLPEIHAYYEAYYYHFSIKSTVQYYMLFISAIWAGTELLFTKVFGLNFSGYTLNQLKLMSTYEKYMFEFIEKYSGVGTGYSPEVKLVGLTVLSAVTYLALKTFAKWIGNGLAGTIQNEINRYLNGEVSTAASGNIASLLASATVNTNNNDEPDNSTASEDVLTNVPRVPDANGATLMGLPVTNLLPQVAQFVSSMSGGGSNSENNNQRRRPRQRRPRNRGPRYEY